MSDRKDPDMADTAELPIMGQDMTSASAGVGRVRVDYAALTHQGLVRPNNEDHCFLADFGLTPRADNQPCGRGDHAVRGRGLRDGGRRRRAARPAGKKRATSRFAAC